jgi:hypothetical protein
VLATNKLYDYQKEWGKTAKPSIWSFGNKDYPENGKWVEIEYCP